MKLTRNRKIGIVLLVIIVLIFGNRIAKNRKKEYSEYYAERRNITQTLELSGEVDAKKKEDLHFLAGGLVTYYPFSEGDEVKRFQTIASLDQRQLKKTLEKYLNLYGIQYNAFSNTQDTYEDEIKTNDISDELRRTLSNAQYSLDNSVLDVEIQDLSIQLSRLYSPFDGILVKSPITTPNVTVSALDLFTIVDPTTLFFNADLDESDLSKIDATMRVLIELDAYPELEIESGITYVSYTSKELTTGTTYEVDIPIPQEYLSELRLGLNGTAVIILSEKTDVLTLPIEAVIEESDRTYVLVKNNGDVKEVEVETGISNDTYIEILSGITEQDKVVLEKK